METSWNVRYYRLFGNIQLICILLIPIALVLMPLNWLEHQHSICLFKNITGNECYGCGISRAIVASFHFQLYKAIHYNKLVIIVLPLLMYVWIKTVTKLINKAKLKNKYLLTN